MASELRLMQAVLLLTLFEYLRVIKKDHLHAERVSAGAFLSVEVGDSARVGIMGTALSSARVVSTNLCLLCHQ